MDPLSQPVPGHSTWGELVDAFARGCTVATGRSYRTSILQFFQHAGITPDQVTVVHVAAWRDSLKETKRSPATIRARVAAVSSFYTFLMQPFGQTGPILRAWLTGFALTGRRRTELASLTWEQIHRGAKWRYKYVGKGGKPGDRELPRQVVEAILAWLTARGGDMPTSGPVWTATARTMARRLKMYAKAAGIDPNLVRLHGLRHLAAMVRWETTGDIRKVKEFLDHSSIDLTDGYLAKLQQRDDDDADDVWRGLTGG